MSAFGRKDEYMVIHEQKNDVSTVRIHDEFYEPDTTRLIGSVSRVVSESYKRRYLSQTNNAPTVVAIPEHQPMITTLQA